MINPPFYLITLYFLIACAVSSSDKPTDISGDNLAFSKADTVPSAAKIQNDQARIDSIDKANSRMIANNEDYIQKATVSKEDSTIWLVANMRLDHRIFGYEKPDITSRRMILVSIFTNDVEGNPFKCPFGAYYQTSRMDENMMHLKYISTGKGFAKVNVVKNDTLLGIVYIDKKWLAFEK